MKKLSSPRSSRIGGKVCDVAELALSNWTSRCFVPGSSSFDPTFTDESLFGVKAPPAYSAASPSDRIEWSPTLPGPRSLSPSGRGPGRTSDPDLDTLAVGKISLSGLANSYLSDRRGRAGVSGIGDEKSRAEKNDRIVLTDLMLTPLLSGYELVILPFSGKKVAAEVPPEIPLVVAEDCGLGLGCANDGTESRVCIPLEGEEPSRDSGCVSEVDGAECDSCAGRYGSTLFGQKRATLLVAPIARLVSPVPVRPNDEKVEALEIKSCWE